jgi:sugar phosphate permease
MLSRVPAGLVGTRASNGGLIVAALAIDAVAALGIGATSSLAVVGAAAALDGVAFGVFLASSQSVVADVSTAATRGAALGIYGTAGAAGEIVGAFGLGTVAEVTSARVAFVAAGCALAECLPAVAALLARATPMAGAQLPSSG